MHPRDFAHAPERVLKTPSVWLDAYLTLAVHDQHLLFPSMYKLQLHGWELRRLLDHKLVSEQEAEELWADRKNGFYSGLALKPGAKALGTDVW